MPFSFRFRLPAFIQRVLDWIGSHELPVMIALLVVAVTIWGFVEIADKVMEGGTAEFDTWLVQVLRNPNEPERPIGPKWLAEVSRDLTALGRNCSPEFINGCDLWVSVAKTHVWSHGVFDNCRGWRSGR